jgi:hypothetical protein
MKRIAFLGTWAMLIAVGMPGVSVFGALAQDQDIVGQWRLERIAEQADTPRGGMMSSILSLSRDKDGKLVGQMVGLWGISEVQDLSFQNGTLKFTQRLQMRDTEFVSQFSGTLKDGKLVGTLTNPRGEVRMEGTRLPVLPDIVGDWEITTTRGQRQMVTVLSVRMDEEGKILATWQPRRGPRVGQETDRQQQGDRPARPERPDRADQADQPQRQFGGMMEVSDVQYKDGVLTFTRRFQGRARQQQDQQAQQPERMMRYTLRAEGDVLTGTVTTPQGDQQPIEGKRVGANAVGTWLLTVSSQRGERTQRLVIRPDLTALYGPMEIDQVAVEDGTISFTMTMGFGDRTFENTFKATLDGDKLTGELTMTGFDGQPVTQQVTGKKIS